MCILVLRDSHVREERDPIKSSYAELSGVCQTDILSFRESVEAVNQELYKKVKAHAEMMMD